MPLYLSLKSSRANTRSTVFEDGNPLCPFTFLRLDLIYAVKKTLFSAAGK